MGMGSRAGRSVDVAPGEQDRRARGGGDAGGETRVDRSTTAERRTSPRCPIESL